MSETGIINIPLICTCKKALVYLVNPEQAKVDFGSVIYGEQCTRTVKLKNEGALPTRVLVKTPDGHTIPFINQEELAKKIEEGQIKQTGEGLGGLPSIEDKEAQNANDLAAQEDVDFAKEIPAELKANLDVEAAKRKTSLFSANPFEEFLAQVQFKRTNDIDGYSTMKVSFTFVPYKLGQLRQEFTLFLENQDYCEPIPIEVFGECVDVPIYVAQEEYNMNVVVYDQFYREKIILHNRSAQPMKLQLFFPRSFKQYLEFNPTLGYIQGKGTFEIWLKFRPDRTILTNCQKYLVKQDDEAPPKDEYEEFTMRIPIKVVGAN